MLYEKKEETASSKDYWYYLLVKHTFQPPNLLLVGTVGQMLEHFVW